ncbi:energy-coupling factor transport system substrate-specific component [Methanococcus maripaludis]|uniref:Energy-coupling factor transport system substrate-specific component n=1 Tax=Methanococcus maripaludis TaxID=39152 RepID=A0A7J9P1D3_METMI|nr:CD3073 family putative ECF transporter S component [Methanococcus maripaludis]MBA2853377.1 energy-coupling factor transport system substrate-specific component [Methanococcus maripaludis]
MDKKVLYMTTIPVGIAINAIGGQIATFLKLPIFLDSIGTVLSGFLLGPVGGALVGFFTNILLGFILDPSYIPFSVVNIVIGLVSGYVAVKHGINLKNSIIVGLVLAIIAPMVGTPIAVYLYGGLVGGGVDLLTAVFLHSGQDIFSSAFLARIPANLVDKLLSCILVYYIIKPFPKDILSELGVKVN